MKWPGHAKLVKNSHSLASRPLASGPGHFTKRSGGVGGTVDSESAMKSAGTLLSQVRAPLLAPLLDGEPESLR
ncbi:hypothetical protein PoB_001951300 [Plakobranchus ocellatus]|uniref:Uncharacterized protein n=1 Tax=Plakobranchus ocellatus TaxID=259542 RepID=A0AAV3ZEX3_9GAST|nr:hypothetical protein PoB_001951300 [Plakobranchus ocellatus]